jgi:dolichol-phosphate mannosyltransferase
MTYLSIVAPIYNEEQNIAEFVSRAKLALANISNDFKIIFIDDGSNDNSWKVIKNISNIDNKITGLKLSKNFGHHYAITAGLNHADSEWVVVMDSDLQDRPEVIPQLYQKAQEGFDVVFVSRVNRPESVVYRILQKLFYFKTQFWYKI